MIKYLKIRDFQSHKSSSLEFSKGVNVIVGSSDSGKSSIIRALRWVIENKPNGNSFINYDSKGACVTIAVDKSVISREKSSTKNEYKDTATGEVYKAVNKEVPQEIKSLINIPQISIQKQMDSPFLLSSSSGEVARVLNEIVNISNIDLTLKNIEKRKRDAKNQITFLEDAISNSEKELKNYDNLDEIEALIDSIEASEALITQQSEALNDLRGVLDYISEANNNLKKYKNMEKAKKVLKEAEKLNSELKVLEFEEQELKDKITLSFSAFKLLNELTKKIKSCKKKFNELMPDICPLCEQEVRK